MLALGQPYCLATDIRDGLFYRVFFLSQSRTKRNLNKQAKNSIINGPVYLFISIYNKTFLFSFGFTNGLVLLSFLLGSFLSLFIVILIILYSFSLTTSFFWCGDFIRILSFPLLLQVLFFFFDDKFLLMSHRKILIIAEIRFWYQIYCSILE